MNVSFGDRAFLTERLLPRPRCRDGDYAAITEAHGGHVELRSAPGEGATFAVHLLAIVPTSQRGRIGPWPWTW
jgi:hypothetical protein